MTLFLKIKFVKMYKEHINSINFSKNNQYLNSLVRFYLFGVNVIPKYLTNKE